MTSFMSTAENVIAYGSAPFQVAVIHGGPGAPGEMAPVAQELSKSCGVLEPFQTKTSISAQILELKEVLAVMGEPPIQLIGFSWGAWLSYMIAAKYPALTKRLILVGSPPFENTYTHSIQQARLSRLSIEEKFQLQSWTESLQDPAIKEKDAILSELGSLFEKTDSFDPISLLFRPTCVSFDIYQQIWREAAQLRQSGTLLRLGEAIRCPIIAIHGDYDPHPLKGVKIPLSKVVKDFRLIALQRCGHKPWIERAAKEKFYLILNRELGF